MKLWGLTYQIEFGNFEEKPGFIERQLVLYFHEFFSKYYKNEKFINDITDYYKTIKGKSNEESMKQFFEIAGDGKGELNHFYKVIFRNSNNPNYKDM